MEADRQVFVKFVDGIKEALQQEDYAVENALRIIIKQEETKKIKIILLDRKNRDILVKTDVHVDTTTTCTHASQLQ
ncbi:unnamed protein product [Didymodactylos carnosus]|uniref:Uncharacterized protein n=1 Tax=Didymodactylos carnosus TaxID=1234261 RepID=A0A813ZHQ5_9BILA|nr:unnamed protein product [Didymodactylos carnosus]CAF3681522.1 unnamed protein product [Didymodactylos carnosus]